ncbi:putative ribonuclease H-like domain-containing protein [Tanacetum coccineum]
MKLRIAAARYGYLFSQATAEILSQAEAEIRNQGVSADRDPAGIDSAGGVSAGKTSAGSIPIAGNPAGTFQPTGSYDPAALGDPAASTSEQFSSADLHILPLMMMDFRATLTNLAPLWSESVPTKRVKHNFIISLGSLGNLTSPVLQEAESHISKFGETKALEVLIGLIICNAEDATVHQQHVWKLVPLLMQTCIGTKWILKNKREGGGYARGIVVRNKARLVAQGHRQEEGIDYDEVFAPVARIEAIRLFLAFASYMGFLVYQLDVKSAFLYGEIEEEVWCDDFEVLMKGEFEMSAMGEMTFFLGLQVKQLPDGIFISQDKYVKDMLTKFDMESVRTATTPYEAAKTKLKDETDPPVNFRKFFNILKGQPTTLALWYPKDSPFQLEAYSDSDYAGSHGDRKSTTGGCQFLGRRLISWQCKKQTIVATSSTEAEYVAAASCCAQVLWIQNQLLDYGFNFMNTKIFIDNQSTICIVKNPVFHQRTKHIEIRHHFIRDANEKNLIQVLKIHTDDNVADLLTKAFDGPRFEYLVVHIGMVDMLSFLLDAWFVLVVLSFYWHISAGGFISADRVCVPAVCMVSAVG